MPGMLIMELAIDMPAIELPVDDAWESERGKVLTAGKGRPWTGVLTVQTAAELHGSSAGTDGMLGFRGRELAMLCASSAASAVALDAVETGIALVGVDLMGAPSGCVWDAGRKPFGDTSDV